MTNLFIFSNDLRLKDNQALYEASINSKALQAVFIFSPKKWDTHNESHLKIKFQIKNLEILKKESLKHSMNLIKSDLIIKIANINPELYQKDASKIINVFFKTLSFALSKNERVELRGFGVFDVKKREARIARNPKNGAVVAVPSKNIPFFRMGKAMKDRINK